MKKETNFETSPLNTQDAKAEAATTLAPDATNGDKSHDHPLNGWFVLGL